MPLEIFSTIISFASIIPLIRLASTCKCARYLTTLEIQRRQRSILYPYVPRTSLVDFLSIMRKHNIIIGGGTALQFMDPCFISNDLDLLVACPKDDRLQSLATLKSFIESFGYEHVPYSEDHVNEYDGEHMVQMFHNSDTGRKIDIIVVLDTTSPTSAIFRFHSTIVMNYITADGLYVAYPLLLEKRLFLLNFEGSFSRPWPSKMQRVLDKYCDRGFNPVLCDSDLTSFGPHSCGRSTSCAHTYRSCIDNRGCAYVFNTHFCPCSRRSLQSVGGRTPSWCIGGHCMFGDGVSSYRKYVSVEHINRHMDFTCKYFTDSLYILYLLLFRCLFLP